MTQNMRLFGDFSMKKRSGIPAISFPIRPVHFSLVSKYSRIENVVKNLYALAMDSGFEELYQIYDLKKEECGILPEDQLKELKIRSRHTLSLGDNRFVSIQPVRTVAFGGIMPNDLPFWIGLSSYPEIITLSSGITIPTGLSGMAYWDGFVQTVGKCAILGQCTRYDCCINSHKLVVNILKQARSLGILKSVLDPTLYWELQDVDRLRRSIQRVADQIAQTC